MLDVEEFYINDIKLQINPSDVNVMDDNWVMEDTYLRSRAVFCYRSHFAATKVVLSIPFEITDLASASGTTFNNTFNCLKLITELNSYPFCFIKNKRIRAYIAPTTVSSSGYMMFAVEEISLVQDVKAGNIVFLEVVLQYFNHNSVASDFEFISDLQPNSPSVSTLSESTIFKKFANIKMERVISNLEEAGLLDLLNSNTSMHYAMGVKLQVPLIFETSNNRLSPDDGKIIIPDGTKILHVTDVAQHNSGSYESMLTSMMEQDFSGEDGSLDTDPYIDSKDKSATLVRKRDVKSSTNTPEKDDNLSDKQREDLEFATKTDEYDGMKTLYVQWESQDIDAIKFGVSVIKISKRNKLASHKISSYKHPLIQYLGPEPVSCQIVLASPSEGLYSEESDYPAHMFFKHIMNTLDYNRTNYPEAEAYNVLKIKSLSTYLLDTDQFLPSQSTIGASSEQQGVDHIVYAFNSADLTSFIEQSTVTASGKLGDKDSSKYILPLVITWLTEYAKNPNSAIRLGKDTDELTAYDIGDIQMFKEIIKLACHAYVDFGMSSSKMDDILAAAQDNLEYLDELDLTEELDVDQIKDEEVPKHFFTGSGNFSRKIIESASKNPAVAKYRKDNTNEVSIKVNEYYFQLFDLMLIILNYKLAFLRGGQPKLPNYSYQPRAGFTNQLKVCATHLEVGYKSGNPSFLNTSVNDFTTQEEDLEFINENAYNSFYGYNYKDLDLEILVDNYNEETDYEVKNIDPFFFIRQYGVLPRNALREVFEEINSEVKVGETFKKAGDEAYAEQAKEDTPDTEQDFLGITYLKLKELNVQENVESHFKEASSVKVDSNTAPVMFSVYEAFLLAGFTKNQALALTAEVGRENDFLLKYISGSHNDPAVGRNIGMISYNSPERKKAFTDYLKSKGFTITNGIIKPEGLASVKAQANFIYKELQSPYYKNKMPIWNKTPNADPETFSKELGSLYVGWAYGQNTISDGKGGRKDFNWGAQDKKRRDYLNVLKQGVESAKADLDSGFMLKPEFQDVKAIQKLKTTSSSEIATELLKPLKNSSINSGESLLKSAVANHTKTLAPALTEQQKRVKAISDSAKLTPIKATREDVIQELPVTGKTIQAVVVPYENGDLVSDGDTLTVRSINEKVPTLYKIRVGGIDAPESTHEGSDSEAEILGEKAKEEFQNLLKDYVGGANKKPKTMSIALSSQTGDRIVGDIKLEDGTNPALTMVRAGLAYPTDFKSGTQFQKAMEEAKRNKVGLWSLPDNVRLKPRSKVDKTLSAEQVKEATTPKQPDIINFSQEEFKAATKDYSLNYKDSVNTWRPVKGGEETARITAPYGELRKRSNGSTYRHSGVDFGVPEGTEIIAAASGKVTRIKLDKNGYGFYMIVDHGNNFSTLYAHLSKFTVKFGDIVKANQTIALSGNTGRSSGPHLHYEVRYKNQPLNPFSVYRMTAYRGEGGYNGKGVTIDTSINPLPIVTSMSVSPRTGVTEENTVFNERELAIAIFQNIEKYSNIGLAAALPAIRVYVTIGNENDKFWLDSLTLGIEYYELKGIKSFKMNCNNDTNPIDVAILEVANPSFLQSDTFMGLDRIGGISPNQIGTDYATKFKNNNLLLKPGVKLSVLCGYNNDPNELEIMFNGSISSVVAEGSQTLTLVCEGFGRELLAEELAPFKPGWVGEEEGGGETHCSTSRLIANTLRRPCISHFGFISSFWKNTFKGAQDPEDRVLGPKGIVDYSYNWGFEFIDDVSYPAKLFINVFSPEIEGIASDSVYEDKGWIASLWRELSAMGGLKTAGYPFALYKDTPWSAMKQAEYRHPNTILKPMWFEDRMTLFYGIKEQMYFANDLPSAIQAEAIKKEGFIAEEYSKKRRDRMKPACNIHIINSSSNLIDNELKLNKEFATTVSVSYFEDQEDSDLAGVAKPWEKKVFNMAVDDNLYPWEIRQKSINFSGCFSLLSAISYGTTELKKECEKMYGGRIKILGNPSIKAGDYAFLDDSERRMQGLVLVREVYHSFDSRTGFVTEIIPGQYVEAANFMFSDLWFKLICTIGVGSARIRTNALNNYSDSDFILALDYLTIANQLKMMKKEFDNSQSFLSFVMDNKTLTAWSSLPAVMGVLIIGNLRSKISKRMFGASTLGFAAEVFKLKDFFKEEGYKTVFKSVPFLDRYSGDVTKLGKGKVYLKNAISTSRVMVAGSKFKEYLKSYQIIEDITKITAKGRGAYQSFKNAGITLSLTKKLYYSMRMVATAAAISTVAMINSNPFSIALELVAMYIISVAIDKIDTLKLARQPLLFFPITRNGKPYTGGIAGVDRNSWLEANAEEYEKTIKQIRKSANIIYSSRQATGQAGTGYLDAILKGVKEDRNVRDTAPLIITDKSGNPVYIKDESQKSVEEVQKNKLKGA